MVPVPMIDSAPESAMSPATVWVVSTCVFCDRPITPDAPSVGRPPIAAHATCADAALADDRHWDEIATGAPEPEEEAATPPPGRTGGCLAGSALVLVAVARLARAARR
jgi:hypothetical protein